MRILPHLICRSDTILPDTPLWFALRRGLTRIILLSKRALRLRSGQALSQIFAFVHKANCVVLMRKLAETMAFLFCDLLVLR